ncbi:MAG: c-type cytochrome [Phycisphaerales bacterium]|nr:c-type cytochrome [Phycisphaerales bacterium]
MNPLGFLRTRPAIAGAGLAVSALVITACSGPQPLSLAIRPADDDAYIPLLRTGDTPRDAFLRQRAEAQGITLEQAAQHDDALTSNPFRARSDQDAVSRGAVIYQHECMACHGENADGKGPAMPGTTGAMNFHRFANRFAVTIHHGAPGRWFRVISEGVTADVRTDDGTQVPVVMPGFKDRLAREQIWLAVTYLQSLDRDAAAENPS